MYRKTRRTARRTTCTRSRGIRPLVTITIAALSFGDLITAGVPLPLIIEPESEIVVIYEPLDAQTSATITC